MGGFDALLATMPEQQESRCRGRAFRKAMNWLLMIVGFALLVFGIKSCQEQARIAEIKARMPAGWLVTDYEIIRLPEGNSVLQFPKYMLRVVAYKESDISWRIYYTKEKDSNIFHIATANLKRGTITNLESIPAPKGLGEVYGETHRVFCVDISGRYVAIGLARKKVSKSEDIVFFYDVVKSSRAMYRFIRPTKWAVFGSSVMMGCICTICLRISSLSTQGTQTLTRLVWMELKVSEPGGWEMVYSLQTTNCKCTI